MQTHILQKRVYILQIYIYIHIYLYIVYNIHMYIYTRSICVYIYISANPGWRVGHLGSLTFFAPPNTGDWATAGTERGYPEPFGLLEPPAQNPGCFCVVG